MQEIFSMLGANEVQSRVYLKLLELGPQPVSVIAKHAGINRTTTYTLIDDMTDIGLVEQFRQENIRYCKATNVEKLEDLLRAKERQLQTTIDLFREKLPELKAKEQVDFTKPGMKFFRGKAEVAAMYDDFLKEKEFCAIFNPELVQRYMPEYHEEIPKTLQDRKGTARELAIENSIARGYKEQFQNARHQIRMLPADMTFPYDSIICPTRVFLVAYGKKDIAATEIRNIAFSGAHQALFDELWRRTSAA